MKTMELTRIHVGHFSVLAAILVCLEQNSERRGLVGLATVFLLGRLSVISLSLEGRSYNSLHPAALSL